MIISASRRTDIPAFYTPWFLNRIRAGYCTVPNPFNRKQISTVSLTPENVDCIVFWTRNPGPMFSYLSELDDKGFKYYFQFTILDYPKEIDPKVPPLAAALASFKRLAECIGPDRVIWRYDPIVFSEKTGATYHLEKYQAIAEALKGSTRRSVISIMDVYPKARNRLRVLSERGMEILEVTNPSSPRLMFLMQSLKEIAQANEMEILSCSEEIDLSSCGILPGRCVDNVLIERLLGKELNSKKDPHQRDACGCVASKDVGIYDTCLFGCQYCYATQSFERAKINHEEHNPESPSLTGWYEAKPLQKDYQLTLFQGR